MNPFPASFRWGVTTSSYQIEGAVKQAGRGESVWDMFVRRPGVIVGNGNADVACDHYNRWQEDVEWLAQLGVNAYRLSIAWPRVLPHGTGQVEPRGLDFYDRIIDALLAKGIEPWVCLFHWDYPLDLFCRGGWLNRDSSRWFADYAEVVVRRLSDRVTRWITYNEPQVFISEGHYFGRHAPGLQLPWKEVLLAAHHALLGHGYAVSAIRSSAKKTPLVGYAPAGPVALPASNSAENVAVAYAESCALTHATLWNLAWWLDPVVLSRYPSNSAEIFGDAMPDPAAGDLETIAQPLDFLGLNLYWGPRVDAKHRGTNAIWHKPVERSPHGVRLVDNTGNHALGAALHGQALRTANRRNGEWYFLPGFRCDRRLRARHGPYRLHHATRGDAALGHARWRQRPGLFPLDTA